MYGKFKYNIYEIVDIEILFLILLNFNYSDFYTMIWTKNPLYKAYLLRLRRKGYKNQNQ